MNVSELSADANVYGLVLRGGFRAGGKDRVPEVGPHAPAKTLMLLGNAGSSLWPIFRQSPEYRDGAEDPLNRWSERIGHLLAERWEGKALFPFGGPPYHPFVQWAKKAEGLRESPLGILMHPEYGLWHAYRFAIALSIEVTGFAVARPERPACEDCRGRPCLQACPVGAFDGSRYDVDSCVRYLEAPPDSSCRRTCKARNACPERVGYRYRPVHAAFHMEKFYCTMSAIRVRNPLTK